MYYIEKDSKIVLADENEQILKNTLAFIPEFKDSEVKKTSREIVEFEGALRFRDEIVGELEAQRRAELDSLSLTKREVFLALYRAKGITPDELKAQITDAQALIEFEYANEYFRGNPLIGQIGQSLGFSSDELDYLFLNKELPE